MYIWLPYYVSMNSNYSHLQTSSTQEDLGSHWTSQHCSSNPEPCIDLYLSEEDSSPPKKSLWAHLRGEGSRSNDGSYHGNQESKETSETICNARSAKTGEEFVNMEQEAEIHLESGVVTVITSSKGNSCIQQVVLENVKYEEELTKAEPREGHKDKRKEEHQVRPERKYLKKVRFSPEALEGAERPGRRSREELH